MEPAPTPKELRDGRYVLVAPLGQGSQGTTWDAVDKREGRPVAIKAFDVRGARAWKDVELAEREARVLSELSHPLLPRYVEHFEDEGVLYLVMEKVSGTPLSVRLKRGPLGEREVLRFLRDADAVLTYLHGRHPPVIHRDLKPSNVIARPDGSFAFVDFGSVRDRLRPEGGSTVVGTFGFMAPEQFQGRAGPATDVYALGATALAMLTGQQPESLPHRGLMLDVEAALGRRVSPELRRVVARMVDPNPDTRAPQIGPLLASYPPSYPQKRETPRHAASPEPYRRPRSDPRTAARAEKQARRESRRSRRRRGPMRLPFPLRFATMIVLLVARLTVGLALGVIVPLVLTLLSTIFGAGLRRAAQHVRVAGERALTALAGALAESERPWDPDAAPVPPARPRVPPPSPRVRVPAPASHAPPEAWEEEADDAASEDPPRRARSRR